MAPVYADHPFNLISTPIFLANKSQTTPTVLDGIASEMANVHNMIIRGLNSIYLQAPHIKPADEKAFCRYIAGWHFLLHSHHSGEESMLFPAVEKMAEVEGIMETNVEQHRAFHDGIDSLKAYANAVVADKEKYDGSRVVALIDGFGSTLTQHLSDEIPSLLSLQQYGDKMAALPKLFEEEGEKAMKEMGTSGMVWCFANLDINFEDGLWKAWPPAPAPVKLLMRSIFWWMNSETTKFGAVDRAGNMQHLYAVPA